MNYLTLKIGDVYNVEIHEAERADACGCKIECGRRAESADADEENLRCLEFSLARCPDLRKDEVAAVPAKFVAGQFGQVIGVRHACKISSGSRKALDWDVNSINRAR